MKTIEDVIFEELGRPFDSFKTGNLVVFTMKDVETIRTVLHDEENRYSRLKKTFDDINTELVSVTNERDHFKTEAEMYKNNDADEWMSKLMAKYQELNDERVEELRKKNEELKFELQQAKLRSSFIIPPVPTVPYYPICPCGYNHGLD